MTPLDSAINEVKLNPNGNFELTIQNVEKSSALQSINLYLFPKRNDSGSANDFVKTTLGATRPYIILLDTTSIDISINYGSGELAIDGGFENRVMTKFRFLDKQHEKELTNLSLDINESFNKKVLEELTLIRNFPSSLYALNRMYTYLRPSLIGFQEQVLLAYDAFERSEIDRTELKKLKSKIDSFYLTANRSKDEFIDLFDPIFTVKDSVLNKTEYVLVDIWATWCGPCIEGHKELDEMAKSPSLSSKLSIISVAVMSEKAAWTSYNEKNDLAFYMYWVDWKKFAYRFKHLVPLYLIVRTKDNKIMERSIILENLKQNLYKYI